MLKSIIKFIFNKYVLSFLFIFCWVLFFDESDFILQQKRLNKLAEYQKEINYYQSEIEKAKQELNDIKNNSESLEKFAREKYFMKKFGEEIFIIENEESQRQSQ